MSGYVCKLFKGVVCVYAELVGYGEITKFIQLDFARPSMLNCISYQTTVYTLNY